MKAGLLVAVVLVAGAVFGIVLVRAQTPDAQAGAAAIMKADRDFNQAVADRDLTRFLSLVAEAATFGGGTSEEIHGREAVAKEWAPFFQADGPKLTWLPTKGEVIGAGDLGYTVGTWERRVASSSGGQPTVTRGNYLTVWKKQANNTWLVVFDTGSTFPPK
jgi:ketosteroid isomerase-like protein